MNLTSNQQAFTALVKAGLWEQEVRLSQFGDINYSEVMRLAEEQSVVGLVTVGLAYAHDVKVPQTVLLQFIGQSLQIEQRNREMNNFIAETVKGMRKAGLYGLLMKGSGLAQCYLKPLWRSCGDIDFFFSRRVYEEAVDFFLKQENAVEVQNAHYTKSFGVVIEPWFIELHGTLRNGLSSRMDREIDKVQNDLFYERNFRSWMIGDTTVFLPGIDDDVFLVFVHFVRHFYKGGLCLRQLCDWCRLLWKYHSKIDVRLLEKRLRRAGLFSEWRGFATVAVEYLGIPVDAMPLYSHDKKWRKGYKIVGLMLNGYSGNKYRDTFLIARIYPWNTLRFLPGILFHLNWLKVKERAIE